MRGVCYQFANVVLFLQNKKSGNEKRMVLWYQILMSIFAKHLKQ